MLKCHFIALCFSEVCPDLPHALSFAFSFVLHNADLPTHDGVLSKFVNRVLLFSTIVIAW